jgi:ankyrin repeat protein
LLDEYKVDPNIAAHDGMNPLILAASLGDVDAVQLLLGNGADPKKAMLWSEAKYFVVDIPSGIVSLNCTSGTPLCIAAENGHIKVVEVLLSPSGISTLKMPSEYKDNSDRFHEYNEPDDACTAVAGECRHD